MVTFMDLSHHPKSLITGAASGVGRAFAKLLASQGYNLVLIDKDKEKLEDLAKELSKEYHQEIEIRVVNLSNRSELNNLKDYVLKIDNLEILINNAGFGLSGHFTRNELVKQQEMINVHITACFTLCRVAIPGMIERNKGFIINVSSMSALIPILGNVVYNATKLFTITFSEALQAELRNTGVKIQVLCPGYVDTEFYNSEELKGFKRATIPKRMWMTADEVAELSLKALKKDKTIFVPGLKNRILLRTLTKGLSGLFVKFFSKIIQKKILSTYLIET